jgi:hypothetical protein
MAVNPPGKINIMMVNLHGNINFMAVNLHGAPVKSLSPEHSAEGAVVLQSHLGHCKVG